MAPEFLFVEGKIECNLKCNHCNLWWIDKQPRSAFLPTSTRLDIIDEFASMNPRGKVVTCGGESMLDLDNYFAISRRSHERGLRQFSVVNGTKIPNDKMARKMISEGPDEISISLDSHIEKVHDRHRGVRGSFMVAVRALRLLLKAREELGRHDKNIHAMLLVFDENYLQLDEAYSFALRDIGVDKLKINIMQPTFAGTGLFDHFYDDHHLMDPEKFREHLELCNTKYNLNYNRVWVEQVVMYLKSISKVSTDTVLRRKAETIDHICNTYDRNIIVTAKGEMKLCFSDRFSGVWYQKPGDLKAFWEGAGELRCRMSTCNDLCGISHSVRAQSCTKASQDEKDSRTAVSLASTPQSSSDTPPAGGDLPAGAQHTIQVV